MIDSISLSSAEHGSVQADVNQKTGLVSLAAMSSSGPVASLSPVKAFELGHWLISVAEELRLRDGS